MFEIILLLLEPLLSYFGFTLLYIYENYNLVLRSVERAEIVLDSYEWSDLNE
jgi:hypothetical protein